MIQLVIMSNTTITLMFQRDLQPTRPHGSTRNDATAISSVHTEHPVAHEHTALPSRLDTNTGFSTRRVTKTATSAASLHFDSPSRNTLQILAGLLFAQYPEASPPYMTHMSPSLIFSYLQILVHGVRGAYKRRSARLGSIGDWQNGLI